MEKLTEKDIRFIDNYLKKEDIGFFDIRLEMTDHIASEIEAKMEKGDQRGFYGIFKEYMLENKSDLLKNYNKFKKNIWKKMAGRIVHNFYHPKTLIFTLLVASLIYFSLDFIIDYWTVIPIAFTWGLGLVYFLPRFFGKRKYSYTHTLMLICVVVNYFAFLVVQSQGFSDLFVFGHAVFWVWFNASAVKTLMDLKVHYKGNFRLS